MCSGARKEKLRMTDMKEALNAVMSGREERAAMQSQMLSGEARGFVCQISLNVPGFPKRLDGDDILIDKLVSDFTAKINSTQQHRVKLENGAGLALLLFFSGGPDLARTAKLAGISIEENNGGRVADIDVITAEGAISRTDLGLGPRACLLCDKPSKECAREHSHTYEELRAKTQSLIGGYISKHK